MCGKDSHKAMAVSCGFAVERNSNLCYHRAVKLYENLNESEALTCLQLLMN